MRIICTLLIASATLCAADGKDWRNITSGSKIPSEGYADQPYVVKTDDGAWLSRHHNGQRAKAQAGST